MIQQISLTSLSSGTALQDSIQEIARLGSLFRDLQTSLLIWLVDSGKAAGRGVAEAAAGPAVDVMELAELVGQGHHTPCHFDTAFNTRRFGVAVLDGELRVVSANRTFCGLVGIDEREIQGVSYDTFTSEAEHQALITETRSARIRSLPSGPRTMELKGRDGVCLRLPAEVRSLSERTVRALSRLPGQRLTTVIVYDAPSEPCPSGAES